LTIDIPEGSADTVYSNTLTSIFRYYLTNRLNVEARVSLTSLEDSVDNNDNDDVDVSTFLGVRYRLR
jgi:hypothetical protein